MSRLSAPNDSLDKVLELTAIETIQAVKAIFRSIRECGRSPLRRDRDRLGTC
jgi:hypothetical protein